MSTMNLRGFIRALGDAGMIDARKAASLMGYEYGEAPWASSMYW